MRSIKVRFDIFLSQAVYQILCYCGKSYIGQTGWLVQTHPKKHIIDTFHKHLSNMWPLNTHKTNRLDCFDQTKILVSTPHYSCHIMKKTIKIDKNLNNFNQKNSYTLSQSSKTTNPQTLSKGTQTPIINIIFNYLIFIQTFPS